MAEYGLLGERLSHSYSKQIHALLGDYQYEHYELTLSQLHEVLAERDFKGMNVTIPYKRVAFASCDELSDEARMLENVNTLVLDKGGKLIGHNTDLFGFERMVQRSGIQVKDCKVAVLGGGGASLTATAACRRLGASSVITVSRKGPIDYEALYRYHTDVQVIVNATPVGMYPSNGISPVDLEALPAVHGVLDMIYNPYRTQLMMDAAVRGIPAENGLTMLVAQAARAAELFTGDRIEDEVIERIRRTLSQQQLNIALIGMPGSGKSSVGKALAQSLGRTFVDIDEEIVRRAGQSIPEIFAQYGEPHFRAVESDIIAEYGKQRALVIATGGGAPMNPVNVRALKQNGELAFIERSLEALEMDGRPLSKSLDVLKQMYQIRLPIYIESSRIRVVNTGTIEETACAVEEGFHEIAGD